MEEDCAPPSSFRAGPGRKEKLGRDAKNGGRRNLKIMKEGWEAPERGAKGPLGNYDFKN